MNSWWRWPEDRRTGRVAWFVIARRVAFLPIYAAGVALAVAGCLLMYGPNEARRLWAEIT